MAAPQDYDLNEDDDMYIVVDAAGNGDWAVADSNEVDVELLLITAPGSWKQNPTTGFGLPAYDNADIDAPTEDEIESGIKLQLKANGFDVNKVQLITQNGVIINVEIDANRTV